MHARTLLLASFAVAGSACGDGGKRPLGASCDSAEQCASGLCVEGQCLDPLGDEDDDGVLNGVELGLGTNPFNADSDGDGAGDGAEVGADPAVPPDSDGDGIADALESSTADADGDCIADQFDPEDRDVRHEQALTVCQRVGLCATHADQLSATCQVVDGAPLWRCDPSAVPGHADSDTRCDGVDEDCDGTADEDFVAESVACAEGSCAAAGMTRCEGGVEGTTCTTPIAATDATCDGVDDDCDGQTDDEVPATPTECGVGACADSGTLACQDGAMVDDCAPGAPAESDATCDGVDDDCDGAADEDFVSGETTCGEGVCRSTGIASCEDGELLTDCTPLDVAAPDDASCDGADNDCDGATDEEFPNSATTCGVGACAATGALSCVAGAVVDGCTPGAAAPDDTTCDGRDDDCNGVADEDYPESRTTCGVGACASVGVLRCVLGEEIDDCVAGPPAEADTTCDGLDDDCDGASDEDFAPFGSSCGTGACARAGTVSCVGGALSDDCQAGPPLAEGDVACDGVDDDCNGSTDDGFAPEPTSCGTGACAGSGVTTCVGGVLGDSCTTGTGEAQDADCDGVDDDCDGATDEEYVPSETSCGTGACQATGQMLCLAGVPSDTCVAGQPAANDATCDGVDDDCDAQTDEDVPAQPTTCGIGACAAAGAITCVGGALVDGCTPAAPNCSARQCGADGCGGSCGTCPEPAAFCLLVGCSELGQCVTNVVQGYCYVGGECVKDGTRNPANSCQICSWGSDPTGWTNLKEGSKCADEGNSCTHDVCDQAGTCQHPTMTDLTACNDGDGSSIGDWCTAGICHGFYGKVQPLVSDPRGNPYEAYRKASRGPYTPAVQAAYAYPSGGPDQWISDQYTTTGATPPAAVLYASYSQVPPALDGTRLVHIDTMWEWDSALGNWSTVRTPGTLRAAWGSIGNEFPDNYEYLYRYLSGRVAYVIGAGRNVTDSALVVRLCSISLLLIDAAWSCTYQPVATADSASFIASIQRVSGTNYLFVNAGDTRTSISAMKVLKWNGQQWASDPALGRVTTKELRAVVPVTTPTGAILLVGAGSSNLLWVTSLSGYTDVAVSGASAFWWRGATAWRNNVVVVGQATPAGVLSTQTDVVIAYAAIDDNLGNGIFWRTQTLWTGQTLLVNALVAPNDNELYLFGGDRGGSILSPTQRALWRFTTSGTPIP